VATAQAGGGLASPGKNAAPPRRSAAGSGWGVAAGGGCGLGLRRLLDGLLLDRFRPVPQLLRGLMQGRSGPGTDTHDQQRHRRDRRRQPRPVGRRRDLVRSGADQPSGGVGVEPRDAHLDPHQLAQEVVRIARPMRRRILAAVR